MPFHTFHSQQNSKSDHSPHQTAFTTCPIRPVRYGKLENSLHMLVVGLGLGLGLGGYMNLWFRTLKEEFFFFFFLISNNFIKKKTTHVHKTYTKGINYNESWLINSKMEEQGKGLDALVHSNKTVRKSCLISWAEHAVSSKDLAFLSLQITHRRQCGIKPHRALKEELGFKNE